jgi:hypothetical protein
MAASGLLRVIPLRNALVSGDTFTENGTAYDLASFISTGAKLYGGMHLVSCSAVSWTNKIQSASSSGFGVATDRFTFTAQTCSAAQWPTPLAFPASCSEARYWRAVVTPTATTDTRLGIIWVAIQ